MEFVIVLLLLAHLTALLMDLAAVVNVCATLASLELTVLVLRPTALVRTAAVAMVSVSVTLVLATKDLKEMIVLKSLAQLPVDLNAIEKVNVSPMERVNAKMDGTVLLVTRNVSLMHVECAMVMDPLALGVMELPNQERFLTSAMSVVETTLLALVVMEFLILERLLMNVMFAVVMERLAAKNNFAVIARLAILVTPLARVYKNVRGVILLNLVTTRPSCLLNVLLDGPQLVPSTPN
jgi:hypothetical protein